MEEKAIQSKMEGKDLINIKLKNIYIFLKMILLLKSSTKYVEGKSNNVKKEYQEEPTLLLLCMGENK